MQSYFWQKGQNNSRTIDANFEDHFLFSLHFMKRKYFYKTSEWLVRSDLYDKVRMIKKRNMDLCFVFF